jgi:hypothetical protein
MYRATDLSLKSFLNFILYVNTLYSSLFCRLYSSTTFSATRGGASS